MVTRYRKELIIFNLCLSGMAFVYDYPAIQVIPWYALIFIVICPLYPLLISGNITTNGRYPFLAAFSSIPATTYGILALCFYPIHMYQNGFNWLGVGQMLWVLLYAFQAVLLLPRRHSLATIGASVFTGASLLLHATSKSYNYLDIANLTQNSIYLLLVIGFLTILMISRVIKNHSLLNRGKYIS